jgi:poly(3-hydroxybutyrate) depolymerase
MLYQAYQWQDDLLAPLRLAWRQFESLAPAPSGPDSGGRRLSAALAVLGRLRLTHARPPYGIDAVEVEGRPVPVVEERVLQLPFASLLRFRTVPDAQAQPRELPRVLLVAPMSGHFATLLRDTLRSFLPDHEVYLTDWTNARDVPLRHGPFGLDEHIGYLLRFIAALGPGAHVVAVCQPCVAALAATALLAEDRHPAQPRSLTLMAGPVDCRVRPTEVNRLANSRPLAWFERELISRVPPPHAGFLRRVYPGFLQLCAFMSMNLARHEASFRQMYASIAAGRVEEARAIERFYDEYFAVNDLPAEFYLETVDRVFQRCELARGQLRWGERPVRPAAIVRTALMTVEGERDDICAVGQTLAAQELCPNIRPSRKLHYVQTGVGHYGVFSGRKWQREIYPRVRELIHASAAR